MRKSTLTKEEKAIDGDLVRMNSEKARAELQRRVEWRKREGLNLIGLMRMHHFELAPNENLVLLERLNVPLVGDVLAKRRLIP